MRTVTPLASIATKICHQKWKRKNGKKDREGERNISSKYRLFVQQIRVNILSARRIGSTTFFDDFPGKPSPGNLDGARPDRGLIVRVAFDPAATSRTAINPGDGNRNPYLRAHGHDANLFSRKEAGGINLYCITRRLSALHFARVHYLVRRFASFRFLLCRRFSSVDLVRESNRLEFGRDSVSIFLIEDFSIRKGVVIICIQLVRHCALGGYLKCSARMITLDCYFV